MLQFIEVAIEELAPERLRGYGEVPRNLFQLLAAGLQEMKGIVRQMDSMLHGVLPICGLAVERQA